MNKQELTDALQNLREKKSILDATISQLESVLNSFGFKDKSGKFYIRWDDIDGCFEIIVFKILFHDKSKAEYIVERHAYDSYGTYSDNEVEYYDTFFDTMEEISEEKYNEIANKIKEAKVVYDTFLLYSAPLKEILEK